MLGPLDFGATPVRLPEPASDAVDRGSRSRNDQGSVSCFMRQGAPRRHNVPARLHLPQLPDDSGRRRPEPTGEQFTVNAGTVVVAIGYRSDEELVEAAEVQHERDLVVIDRPIGRTNRPGVFAGGDCVNGADLVVTAMADGRRAAEAIHAYLTNEVEAAA